MTQYTVHYMKPEHFSRFILGDEVPSYKTLNETHTLLTTVAGLDLEDVFCSMQAEMWSLNGEARPLIEEKGLSHTSMSVGDVIQHSDGRCWAVAPVGFHQIH